jgi:histidinol-phosphate aminotransferase
MFRPAIRRMAPYVPGEQPRPGERLIKLNTNENAYPPSPRVRRAVSAGLGNLRLYPQPRADELIAAASRVYKMPAQTILAGNGSDELLSMIFRATLDRGDRVAFPAPTYTLYDTLAAIQQAVKVVVPWQKDFLLPASELAAARARLTLVCNPNAPSGTLTPTAELGALAQRLGRRLLVIDEAYVDFADQNALPLVRRHPNVIVLRSFSKSFALAGARLGLCFAHPAVIEQLLKVKDSYNLSRPSIAAGVAALEDVEWMKRSVERIRKMRARTTEVLREMGFDVPPSQANFILARLAGRNLAPLAAGLRRKGILVRYFDSPGLRDAIRITIGTPAEMAALFAAIRSLMTDIGFVRQRRVRR